LPHLLCQSINSRLAGYQDLNDTERFSNDPTLRVIGSEKIRDGGACQQHDEIAPLHDEPHFH
jgi:hypothetical protein